MTSSDPISTKKESKILITFPWLCDVCFEGEGRKVVAQSEHQRNDHLNSKKHKKNCEKRRGRELLRTMFFAEKKEQHPAARPPPRSSKVDGDEVVIFMSR